MPDKSLEISWLGCRQSLVEGLLLVDSLDDAHYVQVVQTITQSSIGQHLRHVLDLFNALVPALTDAGAYLDYDVRRRSHPVERERSLASTELHGYIALLDDFKKNRFCDFALTVSSEADLDGGRPAQLRSSLGRELMFVGSHASHHYAIIRIIALQLGIHLPHDFGIAATTRSFERIQLA